MNLSIHIVSIVCALMLLGHTCNAQSAQQSNGCGRFQDTILHKSIYKSSDQPPEPVGGMSALYKQLSKNLKYPKGFDDASGRIIFAFVVEPGGKIDGERIVKSPFGHLDSLTKEFFDTIRSSKWHAGKCGDKYVPVLFVFPINIDISEE